MTARGQVGDYLPPLPACGPRRQDGWPDEEYRRVWRRATASQPPVVPEAAADVTCCRRGVYRSSICVKELAKFFMGLSSSSSLGASDRFCSSVGGYCLLRLLLERPLLCCKAVTPAGAGVLPAAPAAVPSVSGEQQRQVESRSRGRRSVVFDGTDRQAKKLQEEVSFS